MSARSIFSIALSGRLLMISSCSEDFLIREPVGVAAGSVILNRDGIEALLVGTYERLTTGECLFEAFQVTDDGLPVPDIEDRDPLENDMGKRSNQTFIPTNHFLDPRADWIIARRGIDFLGWGTHPGYDWIHEQSNGGPYMTKKYMHFKSEQSLILYGTGFYNGKNNRLYRLANILLWRAEVAVEEGDLELARTLVNQVRNRAKTSTPVMGLYTSYLSLGTNPTVDWTKPAANYKVEPYPSGHPAFGLKEEA